MSTTLLHMIMILFFLFLSYGLRISKDGIQLTKWKEVKEKNKLFWATAFDKNKIFLSIIGIVIIYIVSIILINVLPVLNGGLFDSDISNLKSSESLFSYSLLIIVNILLVGMIPEVLMSIFSRLFKKNTLFISSIYSVILLLITNNFAVSIAMFAFFNSLPYLLKYFLNLVDHGKDNNAEFKPQVQLLLNIKSDK